MRGREYLHPMIPTTEPHHCEPAPLRHFPSALMSSELQSYHKGYCRTSRSFLVKTKSQAPKSRPPATHLITLPRVGSRPHSDCDPVDVCTPPPSGEFRVDRLPEIHHSFWNTCSERVQSARNDSSTDIHSSLNLQWPVRPMNNSPMGHNWMADFVPFGMMGQLRW